MAGKYFPDFPVQRKLLGDGTGDPHETALWHCFATYNGVKELRAEFTQRKAEIEERGRSGELGRLGVEQALKKLASEVEPRLRTLAGLVGQARQHHDGVRAKLTTSAGASKSADLDEAVERGMRRDRTIKRFEALQPAQRREAVRLAMEKHDATFLTAIVGESPSLVDAATARAIETELMRTADKALFAQFQELGGKLDAHGEVEAPHTSPLHVANYVLDDTREWLDSQTGNVDAATVLGRAGVTVGDGPAITLTPEQAKDPAIYRSARELSLSQGKILSIAGPNGDAALTPDTGGTEK